MPQPVTVVGADVAAGRWVAVVLRDGVFQDALLVDRLTELVGSVDEATVVAVDIPIGLPADGAGWPRRADVEARAMVGPRRSSVFMAPPRPVLDCFAYGGGNTLHRALTEKGMSRQSWALRERMLEAEGVAAEHAQVIEVHPEVSFRTLAGEPLAHSKRSWNGQAVRRRLLGEAGVHLPEVLEAGRVPADDLLDAAAAAWSAHRVATGRADSLGEPMPDGRPNPHAGRIWY